MEKYKPRHYTHLYYHVVWGTHYRRPLLLSEMQDDLYRFVIFKCQEYNYQLFAVNGVEDHVHLVLRLRPTVTVSEAVGKLKGSTSHFWNNTLLPSDPIQWQGGYGAFSVGKPGLPKVISYVQNQKQRHRANRLSPSLERTDEIRFDLPHKRSFFK